RPATSTSPNKNPASASASSPCGSPPNPTSSTYPHTGTVAGGATTATATKTTPATSNAPSELPSATSSTHHHPSKTGPDRASGDVPPPRASLDQVRQRRVGSLECIAVVHRGGGHDFVSLCALDECGEFLRNPLGVAVDGPGEPL